MAVEKRCSTLGFDLVSPLNVRWYQQVVEPSYRVPDLGRPNALALIIGNSRALWPMLLAALADDDQLFGSRNPVDDYVTTRITTLADSLPLRYALRWAHEAPPRRFAAQAMADVAGLAARTPTHQSVHPVYGPWIAFRAALILDMPGPVSRPTPSAKPCGDCATRCQPVLDEAVAATAAQAPTGGRPARDWKRWLAIRDACPAGRDQRYSDAQIAYHYGKDLDALRRLVR